MVAMPAVDENMSIIYSQNSYTEKRTNTVKENNPGQTQPNQECAQPGNRKLRQFSAKS